jgi:hypothetical protein
MPVHKRKQKRNIQVFTLYVFEQKNLIWICFLNSILFMNKNKNLKSCMIDSMYWRILVQMVEIVCGVNLLLKYNRAYPIIPYNLLTDTRVQSDFTDVILSVNFLKLT